MDNVLDQLGCLLCFWYSKRMFFSKLYGQQKYMYDHKVHSVPDRIVSISQILPKPGHGGV